MSRRILKKIDFKNLMSDPARRRTGAEVWRQSVQELHGRAWMSKPTRAAEITDIALGKATVSLDWPRCVLLVEICRSSSAGFLSLVLWRYFQIPGLALSPRPANAKMAGVVFPRRARAKTHRKPATRLSVEADTSAIEKMRAYGIPVGHPAQYCRCEAVMLSNVKTR